MLVSCEDKHEKPGIVATNRSLVDDYKVAADTLDFVLLSKAVTPIDSEVWSDKNKELLRAIVYDCHAHLYITGRLSMFTEKSHVSPNIFNLESRKLSPSVISNIQSIVGDELSKLRHQDEKYQSHSTLIDYSVNIISSFQKLSEMNDISIQIAQPVLDQIHRQMAWVFTGLSKAGVNGNNSEIYGYMVKQLDDDTYLSILNALELAAEYNNSSKNIWGEEYEYLSHSVFGYKSMESKDKLENFFKKSIIDFKEARALKN
ncbi:hypothetical protein [Rubritalea tangerina]|uniref:hypothetical protein n=1 Tax=Rubritalea tangerina TaxID=430798 RepID=UPI00361C9CB2